MAKQSSSVGAPKKGRKPLSPDEFGAKYAALKKLEEASDQERLDSVEIFQTLFGIPRASPNLSQLRDPIAELRHSVDVRLLRRAANDGDLEACKVLLLNLLGELHVNLPKGVLTKWPKLGRPGRPRDPQTAQIYERWLKIGTPSLTGSELPKTFFGKQFTAASGKERRRMRDLCRNAVRREQVRRASGKLDRQ